MKKSLYLILILQFALFSSLLGQTEKKALSSTDTLNQFFDAAKKKDYEKMLGFMSPHFKQKILESYYYETMRENSFVLLDANIKGVNILEEGGYFFGEFEYRVKGTKTFTWKAIFVSKINKEWKIDSFPFTEVGIPEFILLPTGLSKGIYHYN